MIKRNSTLLVTGGTGGIGKAIAKRFTSSSDLILILGRDSINGRVAEEEIGYPAKFIHCDVSKEEEVDNVFRMIDCEYGGINYAVNNAGVTAPYAAISDINPADWNRTININLTGVFLSMKQQIPLLRRNFGSALVNISSCAGVVPYAMQSAYVASKAAVNALTQAVALECAVGRDDFYPVRINAVAPGLTLGGMNTPERLAANPQGTERKKNSTAMQRFANADEIADAVQWLLSSHASYVTGTIINVDGGYSAGKCL